MTTPDLPAEAVDTGITDERVSEFGAIVEFEVVNDGFGLIAPGAARRAVERMIAAAAPVIAGAALEPVYDWLVAVMGFPFDTTFADKPQWLDTLALARAWSRFDARRCQRADDPETYRATILAETGWDE